MHVSVGVADEEVQELQARWGSGRAESVEGWLRMMTAKNCLARAGFSSSVAR
jgi:hypothetical protein